MNNISIIIANDKISGEIKLNKNKNKVDVIESSISKLISNRNSIETNFLDFNEIVKSINVVISSMCFSSRLINVDMFTNKKYDDDNAIISKYIYGIANIYSIPHGIVLYHESNELLFICTNIQFMINENIIPFQYTNIDKSKIYKVKRTDGTIQDTTLIQNGGLFFLEKEKKIKIINSFCSNVQEQINPLYSGDLQKGVLLDNFMEINKLTNIKINIPYLSKEIKNEYSKPYSDLVDYYNKELDIFVEKIKEYNITNIDLI